MKVLPLREPQGRRVLGRLTRGRLLLLGGSGLYLAVITAAMIWRGLAIEPEWIALAVLMLALTLGRGRQFIRDWTPFLLLFFAYEAMRGLADNAGMEIHSVAPLERLVFGGHIPTIELQRALGDSPDSVEDYLATVIYFMHFVVPLAVGFLFWINSRAHYWRYVSSLLVVSFFAFVTYVFVPTGPPWWQFPHDIHKILASTIENWSPIYTSLSPNSYAAFPSMHAAYPLLAAFFAWHRYRALSVLLFVWTAAVWVAIVYLGEHYFVDALAGLAYAVAAAAVVTAVARRWQTRTQEPILEAA